MKPENDYTVAEFMTRDLVEVTPGTTAVKCAQVMQAEHVSSAVVLDSHNRLVGIITEKDLARKVVAKGLDPNKVMVGEIMTGNPVSVEPETSLYDAMLLLNKRKIKHLPVVKANVPLGMITAMDVLKVQPALMDILASSSRQVQSEE